MIEQASGAAQQRYFITFIVIAVATLGLANPASAAFRFTKVVDNFTPVPGGGGATFNTGSWPAVSGEWVEFINNGTIWRAKLNGAKLKALIVPGQKIPDHEGTFQQFYGDYGQISGDTVVVVGDNCGGCGSGVGIFTRSISGGPVAKLVDTHDTSATFANPANFTAFPPDFRIADGTVVFQDRQQVFSVPLAGGAVTPLVGPQDSTAPALGNYCCIATSPSMVGSKVFLDIGNVFGRHSLFTVNSDGDASSFSMVATLGTHAPHTPRSYGMNDFEFWGPVLDQVPVFGAGSAKDSNNIGPYIHGIYSSTASGIVRLADSNQAIPGGTDNFNFAWSGGRSPILASNGVVVFGASDSSGNKGLYAVSENGGRIKKIIARNDPINGFAVDDLEVGSASLTGDTLTFFVSYMHFEGQGIYVTKVP